MNGFAQEKTPVNRGFVFFYSQPASRSRGMNAPVSGQRFWATSLFVAAAARSAMFVRRLLFLFLLGVPSKLKSVLYVLLNNSVALIAHVVD